MHVLWSLVTGIRSSCESVKIIFNTQIKRCRQIMQMGQNKLKLKYNEWYDNSLKG